MSTFVKDRLEDSYGRFNIIKNIKNLSLVILDDTISNISYGIFVHSAVIKSDVVTALSAIV